MSELMERARRDDIIRAAIVPVISSGAASSPYFCPRRADGSFRVISIRPRRQMLIGTMISFCRGPDATPENFDRLYAELRRAS